ncbi:hypothetical protein C8J57DRAFT_1295305 [Mycena rebaudengoi]|nr:hypothetical protein C8J57DRAFT_1295305 [Mycena rebaudengoi]
MPAPSPSDVHVLTVAVVMMLVFHAVHTGILTLPSPICTDWIETVASFIKDNRVPLYEKINTITAQVAAIVEEMEQRNIIPWLNPLHLPWKFSDLEGIIFATELSQLIEANLM